MFRIDAVSKKNTCALTNTLSLPLFLYCRLSSLSLRFQGGLANRAERGSSSGMSSFTPRSFGGKSFTNAPKVSRGYDKTNPQFVAKETLRLLAARRKKLEQERRRENKMADL
mmetsp:Transcript_1174/g.1349  ORF Transcript_1174/g.1349 Transcript_1174/m.1349 type:complete len:112 (+) Transcript_1174:985-1320(+)